MNNIIIGLGTQTQAIKAKRLLSSHGMRLSVTKIANEEDGCVYGLSATENILLDCIRVLRQNHMDYTITRQ